MKNKGKLCDLLENREDELEARENNLNTLWGYYA